MVEYARRTPADPPGSFLHLPPQLEQLLQAAAAYLASAAPGGDDIDGIVDIGSAASSPSSAASASGGGKAAASALSSPSGLRSFDDSVSFSEMAVAGLNANGRADDSIGESTLGDDEDADDDAADGPWLDGDGGNDELSASINSGSDWQLPTNATTAAAASPFPPTAHKSVAFALPGESLSSEHSSDATAASNPASLSISTQSLSSPSNGALPSPSPSPSSAASAEPSPSSPSSSAGAEPPSPLSASGPLPPPPATRARGMSRAQLQHQHTQRQLVDTSKRTVDLDAQVQLLQVPRSRKMGIFCILQVAICFECIVHVIGEFRHFSCNLF